MAEVRADLERMRWLAGQVGAAATELGQGRATRYDADILPGSAFGNTSSAGTLYTAWLDTKVEAVAALDHLVGMLESDEARLGEVADVFERMDDEAADDLCATASGLNVFTTHVHSEGSDVRGDEADRTRAGQITEATGHAVDQGGSTIFTGDLNETRDSDTRSGDAISDLAEEYGYTDAGAPVGGTSHGGNRIDYVFTSPGIGVSGTQRVEGHPSDHDGILVQTEVPPDW